MLGCASNVATITIGNSASTVLNLGVAGGTVNIPGNLVAYATSNASISNQLITLNAGGTAGSAAGVGLAIQEGGAVTGYIKTSPSRNAFLLRAPTSTADMSLDLSAGGININQNSLVINASNNVGVGTATVGAKLEVAGDVKLTASSNKLFFNNSNYSYLTDSWGLNYVADALHPMQLQSSLLVGYAATNSNVGKGNLMVQGNTSLGSVSQTAVLSISASNSAMGGTGASTGDNTAMTGNALTISDTTFPRFIHKSGDGATSAQYNFETGKNVFWGESNDTGLYAFRGRNVQIQNKVGINVTPSNFDLDVNGKMLVRNGNSAGTAINDQIVMSALNSTSMRHAIKTRHATTDGPNNAIDFYVWQQSQSQNSTGTKQVMSVTSAGVGVGTTTPAYALDVVGDINLSGSIKINGSNASAGGGGSLGVLGVYTTGPDVILNNGDKIPFIDWIGDTITGLAASNSASNVFVYSGKAGIFSIGFTEIWSGYSGGGGGTALGTGIFLNISRGNDGQSIPMDAMKMNSTEMKQVFLASNTSIWFTSSNSTTGSESFYNGTTLVIAPLTLSSSYNIASGGAA